jgi:hypothetical protein
LRSVQVLTYQTFNLQVDQIPRSKAWLKRPDHQSFWNLKSWKMPRTFKDITINNNIGSDVQCLCSSCHLSKSTRFMAHDYRCRFHTSNFVLYIIGVEKITIGFLVCLAWYCCMQNEINEFVGISSKKKLNKCY